ncbi:MAG: zinc-ribbon domain-containing protein [Gemmataceae bacterium]
MPTIISCPACQRPLRLPDGWLDRQVKCPTCGAGFRGGDGPAPPLASPEQPGAPEGEPQLVQPGEQGTPTSAHSEPRHQRSPDLDDCPKCGETIRIGARACRNCGAVLVYEEADADSDRSWERYDLRRDSEPHRGSAVLVMGFISLICSPLAMLFVCCPPLSLVLCVVSIALGVPAWAMGHGDLRKIEAGTMDPRGRGRTQAGKILGVIGTLLSVLVILAAIAFLVYWINANGNIANRWWWGPGVGPAPGRKGGN